MLSKTSSFSPREPNFPTLVSPKTKGIEKSVHLVQFYEHQDALIQTIMNFVHIGLMQEEGVLIIATEDHRHLCEQTLRENGFDVSTLKDKGQLVVLDALEMLAQFMEEDKLNDEKFKTLIHSVLTPLKRLYPLHRGYGEMVDILCERGHFKAALTLEQLWNERLNQYAFNLLCVYNLKNFKEKAHRKAFHKICCAHWHVIPEHPIKLNEQNAQSDMLRLLREKAQRLKHQLILEKKECLSAQKALLHKEENYRTLLSILPVGVIVKSQHLLHPPKIFLNQRLCEITGLSQETIETQGWLEFIHPDDKPQILQQLENFNHTAQGRIQLNYRYLHPHGSTQWFSEEKIKYRNTEDNVENHVSTVGDITHIQQLKKEHSETKTILEAQQYQRLVEAEEHRKQQELFIDALCHELRNPLAGIYGNMELLKKGLAQRQHLLCNSNSTLNVHEKNKLLMQLKWDSESVEAIEKCIAHQKVITDDVLNLSKLEASKVELQQVVFNPKIPLINVTKMFAAQARRKNLKLHVNLPVEDTLILGDPDRLSQILINLLANSLKFTDRGRITLGLDVIHSTLEDTVIQITIEDTGIGLTPEEKARLFNRFAQASTSTFFEHGGSGLGLFICKNLITLMGGDIQVESTKGVGSTFVFTFKAQKALSNTNAASSFSTDTPLTSASLSPRSPHILIVEDNHINQRVMQQLLERIGGYTCHLVENGLEALEQIKKMSFGLIFMDIQMPVMDGITATYAIRHFESHKFLAPTPIIGLSGNAGEHHRRQALESGMNDYIIKPIKKEKLFAVVKQYLNVETSPSCDDPIEASLYETIRSQPMIPITPLPPKATHLENQHQVSIQATTAYGSLASMGLSVTCFCFGIMLYWNRPEEETYQYPLTALLLLLSGCYILSKKQ